MQIIIIFLTLSLSFFTAFEAVAAPEPAPDRQRGEGPYGRLILRGVTVINGEGAPPVGPVDIVIEDNRIASIRNVGYPCLLYTSDAADERVRVLIWGGGGGW